MRKRTSLFEPLESRFCLSLTVLVAAGEVSGTFDFNNQTVNSIGFAALTATGGRLVLTPAQDTPGSVTLTFYSGSTSTPVTRRGSWRGTDTLVTQQSKRAAPKNPAPQAEPQSDAAPVLRPEEPSSPLADQATRDRAIDSVFHTSEAISPATTFVPPSAASKTASLSVASVQPAAALSRLEQLSAASTFSAELRGSLTGVATDVLTRVQPLTPLKAEARALAAPLADAAVGAAASAAVSIVTAPTRYFGFSYLALPCTLSADSVAAFAEESASLTVAAAAIAASAPGPWNFTLAVLAADCLLLTHIYRRRLATWTGTVSSDRARGREGDGECPVPTACPAF